MEIKKNMKFVCIKDVIMEGSRQVNYVKGDVYTSEQDGCITNMLGERAHSWTNPECQNFFIPYSQLDKVYTKHTPLLEKILDKYEGKKVATTCGDIKFFDNVNGEKTTGWFVSTSWVNEGYYQENGYTYLSEQVFIEYMDLGKYIGSLNVESEEPSYSFPTDWYLNLGNLEVDIDIIRDYLRGLDGVHSNFITDVHGFLLGQDTRKDGSYQYWGSDKQLIEKKYKLVEISYQDFLDNVYPKKEVVGDTSQPKYEEEVKESERILSEAKQRQEEHDAINPQHYNQYSIQPLDYIEANGLDFCEGNVIKYVSRYKQKNGLEDLKKAQVYLRKLIDRYDKK